MRCVDELSYRGVCFEGRDLAVLPRSHFEVEKARLSRSFVCPTTKLVLEDIIRGPEVSVDQRSPFTS